MTGENDKKTRENKTGKSYGAALLSAGKQTYFETYFEAYFGRL